MEFESESLTPTIAPPRAREDISQSSMWSRPREAPKRGLNIVLDTSLALAWAVCASSCLTSFLHGGSYLNAGLFVYNTCVVFCFVCRRSARRQGLWWENLLAWAGALLPIVAFRPASHGLHLVGLTAQSVALTGVVASLLSLGRSFGIAPADRGLVTRGPYRFIRHPLYAFELLLFAGFLVANLSWANLAAWLALTAVQVARLTREERIVSDYAAYARRVRWRLVPFAF